MRPRVVFGIVRPNKAVQPKIYNSKLAKRTLFFNNPESLKESQIFVTSNGNSMSTKDAPIFPVQPGTAADIDSSGLESPVKATTRTIDEDHLEGPLNNSDGHADSESEDKPLHFDPPSNFSSSRRYHTAFSSSTFTTSPNCRKHCYYWTLSCFCPCVLLANISSKLEREIPFTCFRYQCCFHGCTDLEFGAVGCKTCLETGAMALFAWPCSGILSVHSLWQRYKFKLFYPEDYRLRSANSYSSWFYYLLNWPENILEQHQFVKDLYQEGQLTFKWDFDRYQDQQLPRPPEKTFIMMMFAAHTPAKMEFVRKFMMSVDRYNAFEHPVVENGQANNDSSLTKKENKHSKDEDENDKEAFGLDKLHVQDADSALLFSYRNQHNGQVDGDSKNNGRSENQINTANLDDNWKRGPLEGIDQIHSWIRNLSARNADHVSFLEVWDIPTFKFNVFIVRNHTMHSDIALYIFDPSMTDEEIELIKHKYQDNIRQFAAQHEQELLKLLKDDEEDAADDASTKEDEASKKTASYLLVLATNNIIFRRRGIDEVRYQERVNDLVDWVKKQGSPWEKIQIEDEKDYYRFNKEISRILRSY